MDPFSFNIYIIHSVWGDRPGFANNKKSLLLSKTSDHASDRFPTQGTHAHTAVSNFSDRLTIWYYLVLPSSHLLFFQRALTMEALHGCLAKSTVLLDALSCFSRSRWFSAFFLAPVFFFGIFSSKREKRNAVPLGATQRLCSLDGGLDPSILTSPPPLSQLNVSRRV